MLEKKIFLFLSLLFLDLSYDSSTGKRFPEMWNSQDSPSITPVPHPYLCNLPSGKADLSMNDLEKVTQNVLISYQDLKIIKQVGEGINMFSFFVFV